jgi:NAD(P) transhydrogenase subunit beta
VSENLSNLLYLVSIVSFIVALKFLSTPARARRGNQIGAAGMLLAIAVTLAKETTSSGVLGKHLDTGTYWLIAIAAVIGSAIGLVGARKVKMTAMPQMVALFNGVGGGAVALVALAEYHNVLREGLDPSWDIALAIGISGLIGCVSFAGSIVAFAKLQELIHGQPITYPGQKVGNLVILAAAFGLAIAIGAGVEAHWALIVLLVLALAFGVLFVLPIGGADMPVVISLLNAFTGIAAAASGFELGSNVLIVSGMLVGASGTLLTLMMGKAMNRSVGNVLFGAFGQVAAGAVDGAAAGGPTGTVRSTSADDVAIMLAYARKVVIVPGYGLAVAQAQHNVRELADELEKRNVDVVYAIHPVAGRMPGHMNVLLAEANVPYTALKEMEEVNPEFPQADVALVIGANDVTNPAARSNPASPIYGMPILDVDKAQAIVVMKRSMRPGFAGIDNELYLDPKCMMLFGDAKDSVVKLVSAVKAL